MGVLLVERVLVVYVLALAVASVGADVVHEPQQFPPRIAGGALELAHRLGSRSEANSLLDSARFAEAPAIEVLSSSSSSSKDQAGFQVIGTGGLGDVFAATWTDAAAAGGGGKDKPAPKKKVAVKLVLHRTVHQDGLEKPTMPVPKDVKGHEEANRKAGSKIFVQNRDPAPFKAAQAALLNEIEVHAAMRDEAHYSTYVVPLWGVVFTADAVDFNFENYQALDMDSYLKLSEEQRGDVRGLIYQRCDMDLAEWVKQQQKREQRSFAMRLRVATALGKSLAWVNQLNIGHNDINPSNVLVCEGDKIKISDFGLANVLKPDRFSIRVPSNKVKATLRGSPGFIAPELTDQGKHIGGLDVWAAGVVVAQVLGLSDLSTSLQKLNAGFWKRGQVTEVHSVAFSKNGDECAEQLPVLLSPKQNHDGGAPASLGPFDGIVWEAESGTKNGVAFDAADAKFVHVHVAAEVHKVLSRMLACSTRPGRHDGRVSSAEAADLLADFAGRLTAPFNARKSGYKVVKKGRTSNTWREVELTTEDCGLVFHSYQLVGTGPARCIDVAAMPCSKLDDCVRKINEMPPGVPAAYREGMCWEVTVGFGAEAVRWQLCRKDAKAYQEAEEPVEDVPSVIRAWFATKAEALEVAAPPAPVKPAVDKDKEKPAKAAADDADKGGDKQQQQQQQQKQQQKKPSQREPQQQQQQKPPLQRDPQQQQQRAPRQSAPAKRPEHYEVPRSDRPATVGVGQGIAAQSHRRPRVGVGPKTQLAPSAGPRE